jgi:hypothetical protein
MGGPPEVSEAHLTNPSPNPSPSPSPSRNPNPDPNPNPSPSPSPSPSPNPSPNQVSEAHFTPVEALISHPITALLEGMPMAVRWCAHRLSSGGQTLDKLYGELERLPRAEMLRLIATNTSTTELASVPGGTAG